FNGFAGAQASGAITSWLDTNYQKAIGEGDPERENYGFSRQRIESLNRIVFGLSFIVGGMLSTVFGRRFVFSTQAGTSIILIIFVLILVKDIKTETQLEQSISQSKKSSNYFKYLKGGIAFLLSNKAAFFFLLGTAVWSVTWWIWGVLLLLPIYFGYSGSDGIAGILRTIIYFLGASIRIFTANFNKRFSVEKLSKFLFLHLFSFFSLIILLLVLVPITNTFTLLGFILLIIIMNAVNSTFVPLIETLRRRIMLDFVPSENRNAIYSLIPTLVSLIAIPILPLAGILVERYNIVAGVYVAFSVAIVGSVLTMIGLYFINQEHRVIKKEVISDGVPVGTR
ncbi:MAG: hypothetical protein ACXAD7_19610, partial [Candidatus Kariarchaeaceae archaeon]